MGLSAKFVNFKEEASRLRCKLALGDRWREHWLRRGFELKKLNRPPFPSVCYHNFIAGSNEANRVRSCFVNAFTQPSRLPVEIRSIRGMSGQKYRSFVNQLIASIPDARYLEIGSWAGSTAVAALYGNRARAICIDNWSQFGEPRSEFFTNIERVLSDKIDFQLIESDFCSVDDSKIGTFNVYMFDGPHTQEDHYNGIVLAQPALDNPYVLIVDDWNLRRVRLGTFRALRDLRCKLEYAIEVRTTLNDTDAEVVHEKSEWHNGYFITVIRKVRSGTSGVQRTKNNETSINT